MADKALGGGVRGGLQFPLDFDLPKYSRQFNENRSKVVHRGSTGVFPLLRI